MIRTASFQSTDLPKAWEGSIPPGSTLEGRPRPEALLIHDAD
jgi:hypothetical protein